MCTKNCNDKWSKQFISSNCPCTHSCLIFSINHSEQKSKVSELIVLKGAESIFRGLIPLFGLLFSFSAFQFVTVFLQV